MQFLATLCHRLKKTVNLLANVANVGRESTAPPASRLSNPVTFWSALSARLWGDRDVVPRQTKNHQRETPNGPANGHPGGRRPKCTACRHPERFHIDQALMHGATLESLAKTHGLSVTALHRHKEHLQARLRQAAHALHETYELDRLLCLARNLHRLEARAEVAAAHGDDQNLCRLNREIHRNLKAMDAMDFRFRNLDEAILFQTVMSPDWPEQITALPTDPAVLAAYRRLLVQGLSEPCPRPFKTARPSQKRQPKAQPPPAAKSAFAPCHSEPRTLNPEPETLNSELKKTTGKQAENFPFPGPFNPPANAVEISQQDNITDIICRQVSPPHLEKNKSSQVENSTPRCGRLTECNPWEKGEVLVAIRSKTSPEEVFRLHKSIPAPGPDPASADPAVPEPPPAPPASTPGFLFFRERRPAPDAPPPTEAETVLEMNRRLGKMLRSVNKDYPRPCRRRSHWDDW